MNQPPGGFDPPNDDGYGGSGRRGGTIPGGPPIEVDASGMPIGPPAAGGTPSPGGPAATVVDHAVSPAAFGQPPGVMPAPGYPAPNAGPIGYAPAAPPRRRSGSSGSGLGIVFAMGFVVLLIGGGAAGAVIYARGASGGTEEDDTPPILTFAPPSTIEAEGAQPSLPEDPITDPGEVPLDGTDPGVATPPPPATTYTPPPATTTARPPSTSTATATATSTAKPPSTTTGTSTVRPPGPTPTTTTTATTTATATATSTRWRTPWVIKPPGTSTATATGTSTAPPPSTTRRPPRFKIPRPK